MNRSRNVFGLVGEFLNIYRICFLILFFVIIFLNYWKIKYSTPNIFAQGFTTNINSPDYDPEKDPQVNPSLHTFSAKGAKNYYNANHPIDWRKPCFGYIFDKGGSNQFPNMPLISNTWEISRIAGIDNDSSWKGSNATSFVVNGPVYLPPSGYHIDQSGHQASILYMDANSITVNYTADGTIAYGYTISIKDINVNIQLLNLYQKYQLKGKLVAIGAMENLGLANRDTKFFIRDTGAILDLGWQDDWWTCKSSAIDTTEVEPNEIGRGVRILWGMCSETLGKADPGEFRPNPCSNCETLVPDPIESCAESPTLTKEVKWYCGGVGEDGDCGNKRIVRSDWGSIITLDTSETKVPFVGYKEIVTDIKASDPNNTASLNHYLADYIEGTALFDQRKYDLNKVEDQQALLADAGVFRKLAPLEIQDSLRKKLVLTGLNYEVTDGETKATLDEWAQKPEPYPKGRFPPDMRDPSLNYKENYIKWSKTKWGILWNRIPLFSREDAPAIVRVTLEHEPSEIEVKSKKGEAVDKYTAEFPMAVPHVTRLYQASKSLNDLLLPTIKSKKTQAGANNLGGLVIAAAKTQTTQVIDNQIQSQVLASQAVKMCNEESNIDTKCEGKNPLADDRNRNDSICCNASFEAKFIGQPKEIGDYDNTCDPAKRSCEEYKVINGIPYCIRYGERGGTVKYERKIEVKTELPYLEEIWKLLADEEETSVFSMFMGGDLKKFPDDDAVSTIKYNIDNKGDVNIDNEVGDFYFPYLGGIQKAKKCISEEMLVPEEFQIGDKCSFLKE